MTSLTVDEFLVLVPVFAAAYEASRSTSHTQAGQPRQRHSGGGSKARVVSLEDKRLFILMYHKTYPLQTAHGLQFDLSQAQTHTWIHRLRPILERSLGRLHYLPEREAQAVQISGLSLEAPSDLIIDGTERRRQRPKAAEQQRASYSGKKKAHTDKIIILINTHLRQVVYLSQTYPGKTHDKKIADGAAIQYPPQATLTKDTGFQGYEPPRVLTFQPRKKPKGQALGLADRFVNRLIARTRMPVAHVIAGIKRCRIVKDVFRNTKQGLSDRAMSVACALHNLRISVRQPSAPLQSLMDYSR